MGCSADVDAPSVNLLISFSTSQVQRLFLKAERLTWCYIASSDRKMPFSSLEIQLIHKLVGELCQRRAPDNVKDKIRLSYTIDNQQVIISEERPFRDPSSEWIVLEIAKLRYVRKRNEWQLYWKRASGKWWPYEPHSRSKTLEAMIEEIDVDSDGCFFG